MRETTGMPHSDRSLVSEGEMERLIRQFDWAGTPIGAPECWSESLKSIVRLMLANRFPMLLWWGEEYIQLYNDAYIPVLGLKHPSPGLGRSGYECWDEVWSVIGPLVDKPFSGGEATWMEDILLKVYRNNFVEETHFTIAYSPVPDPTAPKGIGGVLALVHEITGEIISKRQMETLQKLGKGISSASSVIDVYEQAVRILQQNSFDIPFVFIHRIDASAKAVIAAAAGIDSSHPELEGEIDLSSERSEWQPFLKCAAESKIVVAENNQIKTDIPRGAWDTPPAQFAYLPIREAKRGEPIAIVTVALNPLRKFEDSYSNFLQLIVDQISSGVTNVLAYEKEKRRAEELAKLDRAKTTFFGNVSHEFRTPLTLMLGPIDDLLAQRQEEIVTTREVIGLIHRNALRLQKLVNTLLDFSRIEAGRMHMVFKPTDISKLTIDLASNFSSAIEKAGLKLEVNCPPFSEPVYVDEEMWEKVVLNLLSNAFKFTFEGKIGVQLEMLPDTVALRISDTGIGISPEDQARIFERFHRVSQARSRSFEGSGIGLSLVNELVRLHGGSMEVESEPDKGTTFTVKIPRGNKHIPDAEAREPADGQTSTAIKAKVFLEEALRWFPNEISEHVASDSNGSQPKAAKPLIVLADDNADMRAYIESILSEYFDVRSVTNGRAAFDLIKDLKPDLVISDIMMPEVDGLKLLEMVRKDMSLKTTPVILVSARAGEEARIEGFQAGADDYLTKPFTRNELISRVNSNIQLSNVRKEIDEAIRQSESRLRALVMATSDVVYRMSHDWKIMWQLDGRNFLQDTGQPLSDWEEKYIHPKDHQRVWQVIREAIETKNVFQLEHQIIRADGTLGWTLSRAVPILDRQGNIVEWFGVASDISDRKIHEAELQDRVIERTKELNEANSALKVSNSALKVSNDDLQQFAHVASHDLKEPVRKIKTFTYQLMDEAAILMSERSQTYLRKILTSAERMSSMIDGVLTYSSLNGSTLQFETVDLNLIVEDVKLDLELLIHQKNAAIRSSCLPQVVGGRLLLYQLFYNLVSNSLKFSHPARAPEIQIGYRLEGKDGGKTHLITVKDNGIGFEPDFKEHIFDTFSRLNAKDEFDGTGLGLSLCRKIVERHQGSISANGKKGEGAVFTIELPVVTSGMFIQTHGSD